MTGSSMPEFPQEILDHIVDCIWVTPSTFEYYDDYREGYHTLCACALVCRDMRKRSQDNLLWHTALLNMDRFKSFIEMLDGASGPKNARMVKELVVSSTSSKPSPAESFSSRLAHKLPSLRTLSIWTEMESVEEQSEIPLLCLKDSDFATLASSFRSIKHLQLIGLRFVDVNPVFRLLQSLQPLEKLHCERIWFDKVDADGDPQWTKLRVRSLDIAFTPRFAVQLLLQAVEPELVSDLFLTLSEVTNSRQETEEFFRTLADFKGLKHFTFSVPVSSEIEQLVDYSDLTGVLALLTRNVNSITIAHYSHGKAREHTVFKSMMLDVVRDNADLLQQALDPSHFSQTRVVFQFQGFHGSESWWEEQLRPLLPKLSKNGQYFTVQNDTDDAWSPWADDKERSEPT